MIAERQSGITTRLQIYYTHLGWDSSPLYMSNSQSIIKYKVSPRFYFFIWYLITQRSIFGHYKRDCHTHPINPFWSIFDLHVIKSLIPRISHVPTKHFLKTTPTPNYCHPYHHQTLKWSPSCSINLWKLCSELRINGFKTHKGKRIKYL